MIRNMRRLHPRGAASRGICVDAEGATLGPDCTLVRHTSSGYRAIARDEASALQKCLSDASGDQDWLFRQCQRIADALNKGEIALAQIHGLRIPVDELDARLLARVALAKAGFNPDEPRIPKGDPHGGEWTTGDGSADAPTNLFADFTGAKVENAGITIEMKSPAPAAPPSPSTLDSPDLTSDGSDADYGGGSDETSDNDAIAPVYPLENLLFILGTGGLVRISSALARALIRAGISRAASSDAHHVVALNAKPARPAREILQRFGIGLNDDSNGVFLPEAQHDHMHTNAYYDAVNEALAGVTTKAEVEEILRSIARKLEAGTFP